MKENKQNIFLNFHCQVVMLSHTVAIFKKIELNWNNFLELSSKRNYFNSIPIFETISSNGFQYMEWKRINKPFFRNFRPIHFLALMLSHFAIFKHFTKPIDFISNVFTQEASDFIVRLPRTSFPRGRGYSDEKRYWGCAVE